MTKKYCQKKKIKHKQGFREPKIISFIAGLILVLLILFGCTEMTSSQKNLCYSLASKSYAYVPVCETEKSCYDKVSELFKTNLGYEQESKLYEIKNSVARSWFYFNGAVKETKELSKACSAGDGGAISARVGQIQFYIDNAFSEMDEGVRGSFGVVINQENLLTKQKIDLVKEEAIYSSLIELRQIITELNNGPTNSDSYVSYYSNKAKAFNDFAANKGFVEIVEQKSFIIEGSNFIEETLKSTFGSDNKLYFPFLFDAYENAVGYLENLIFGAQGITALQKFPISNFMKLYSDLAGSSNSSLKRFADLMNRTSANYEAAITNSKSLWASIESKYVQAQKKLDELKQNNQYAELYAALATANITTKTGYEERFSEITKEKILLKENKAKGVLSIGEELLGLKQLNSKLNDFLAGEEFNAEATIQKLVELCGKKAQEIKSEEYVATNTTINQLISDVKYFAAKTLSNTGEERLMFCNELIIKQNELSLALSNYAQLEAQKKDSAKDCFSYLDAVFKYAELYELENTYTQLKNTTVTQDNLLFFSDACNRIRQQVNAELSSTNEAQLMSAEYAKLRQLIAQLEAISVVDQNAGLERTLSELKNKLASYEKYFVGQEINFSEFLPAKDSILAAITNTLNSAQGAVKTILNKYSDTNSLAPELVEVTKKILDNNYFFIAQDSNATKKSVEALFELNKTLVIMLENQLVENETDLLDARVVPPITKSRLTRLELMNNEVFNSNKSLGEKQAELEKINWELTTAAEYLKKEAIIAFNKAIDAKATSSVLSKAKDLIDKNNYAQALLALTSAAPQSESIWYFQGFIPILLVIIVAFVVKYQVGKKKNSEDLRKGMLLEEWEK